MQSSTITGALRAVEHKDMPGGLRAGFTVGVGVTVTTAGGTLRTAEPIAFGASSAYAYDRDMLRAIINGKATMARSESGLTVTVKGLSHSLAPVETWPDLPENMGGGTMSGAVLAWLASATDTGASLPALAHVQFDTVDGDSRACGTDRFRLHYAPAPAVSGLIPARACEWVAREASVRVAIGDVTATVKAGALSVTVRTGHGDFPRFRNVIPGPDTPRFLDESGVELLRPYLSDKAIGFVRFTPEGMQLLATAGKAKHEKLTPGAVLATLPPTVPHVVTVRADFLRDALALPAPAQIYSVDSHKAMRIDYATGEGAVVMPIRS